MRRCVRESIKGGRDYEADVLLVGIAGVVLRVGARLVGLVVCGRWCLFVLCIWRFLRRFCCCFLGSELVGGLVQAYVSSDGDGEPKHYSHGWLSLTHSVIHSDLLTHLLTY